MGIRLPVDASQNVQAAFRDVEQELEELRAAVAALSGGTDLTAVHERIDKIQPPPRLDSDEHTFVGAGSQHSVGLVPDPGTSGGDTSRVLGESGAWVYQNVRKLNDEDQNSRGTDDIYQVPGSLHVAGDAVVTNLQTNTVDVYGKYRRGVTVLYSRDSNVTGAAAETTAATVGIDADLYMPQNGDRIIIEQWGSIAQVTWTLKSYYGSAVITSWTDVGYGGATFLFRVTTVITRTGSATQSIRSQVSAYNTGAGTTITYTPAYVAGAQSNSGIVTVKTTITDAGADATENSCYIYAMSVS